MVTIGFSASADNIRFTMEGPKVVALGEQFRLCFTLNANGSDLELPDLSNFDVLMGPSTSQSSSFQIINGKTTQIVSFSYIFILRSKKKGKFTISPASIKTNGKTFESNSIEIQVVKGQLKDTKVISQDFYDALSDKQKEVKRNEFPSTRDKRGYDMSTAEEEDIFRPYGTDIIPNWKAVSNESNQSTIAQFMPGKYSLDENQKTNFIIRNAKKYGFYLTKDSKYNNPLMVNYKIDLVIENNTNYKFRYKNIDVSCDIRRLTDDFKLSEYNFNNGDSIWMPHSTIKLTLKNNREHFLKLGEFDHTPQSIPLNLNIYAHNIDCDFNDDFFIDIINDWKEFQKALGLRDE